MYGYLVRGALKHRRSARLAVRDHSGLRGVMADFLIVAVDPGDERMLRWMAELLVEGFRTMAPDAWPDLSSAEQEVRDALKPGRTCRVAVDDSGGVLGWIGGISAYDGHACELHPLVVDQDRQGLGIGRALVADLEEWARAAGASVMYLGTDDQAGLTSLGGADLFPGVLDHLRTIRNVHAHPFEFYQRCGFEIVGVIPDANGPGKPDIFMAKSLRGGRDG